MSMVDLHPMEISVLCDRNTGRPRMLRVGPDEVGVLAVERVRGRCSWSVPRVPGSGWRSDIVSAGGSWKASIHCVPSCPLRPDPDPSVADPRNVRESPPDDR